MKTLLVGLLAWFAMFALTLGLLAGALIMAPAAPLQFPRDAAPLFGTVVVFLSALVAAVITENLWRDAWNSYRSPRSPD